MHVGALSSDLLTIVLRALLTKNEILEQLAAEAARAHHEHAADLVEEHQDVRRRLKWHRRLEERAEVALIGERPRTGEHLAHVRPFLVGLGRHYGRGSQEAGSKTAREQAEHAHAHPHISARTVEERS